LASREKFRDRIDCRNRSLNVFLNEGIEDGGDSSPLCGLRITITDGLRNGPVLKQGGHFGDTFRAAFYESSASALKEYGFWSLIRLRGRTCGCGAWRDT
jgi:hypothetical protein